MLEYCSLHIGHAHVSYLVIAMVAFVYYSLRCLYLGPIVITIF